MWRLRVGVIEAYPRASNAYLYKVRHGILRTRKDWPIPEETQTGQVQ